MGVWGWLIDDADRMATRITATAHVEADVFVAELLKPRACPKSRAPPAKMPTAQSIFFVGIAIYSIGVSKSGSSFRGAFTLVDIGHIVISSDGNGFIRSRGSGSSLSQR